MLMSEPSTQSRKDEHLNACLDPAVRDWPWHHGFDAVRLVYDALPEIDLAEVQLATTFLGFKVKAPLFIGGMTGGSGKTQVLNQRLALSAEKYGLAMGVGSQRVMLEDASCAASFQMKKVAPGLPCLIANIGAVQLGLGVDAQQVNTLCKSIDADVLAIHLNPLQEAIQPEGQPHFKGLLKKLAQIIPALSTPCYIKEVGAGISGRTAFKLKDLPIAAIDVSGCGGTSWAYIEGQRRTDSIGDVFKDFGLSTYDALMQTQVAVPRMPLLASGGISSGVDIVKALCMGAQACGMSQPLLVAAEKSQTDLDSKLEQLLYEIKVAMFAIGAKSIDQLGPQYLEPADPATYANANRG